MAGDKRKSVRVSFENGLTARMIGIDGTWARACIVKDASTSGAKLIVSGSFEGLSLREFFLVMSSTGTVYRRCEMVRVSGDEVGVRFLTSPSPGKNRRPRAA